MDVLEFGLSDTQARSRYDALFESCPDALIQQSTWWAEVIQDLGPDRPIFLLCECNGAAVGGMPLYSYQSRLGSVLISIPQAGPLGGAFVRPHLNPAEEADVYAHLIAHSRQLAERSGAIALTIITNPFRDDLALYERHLEPHYTFENFSQYVPLETGIADGRIRMKDGKTRKHLYQDLRRATEAGYVVTCPEGAEDLERCAELHRSRYTEIGAPPLSSRLFDGIARFLLPRGKARILLVKRDGRIASCAWFIHHQRVIDLFSISMDEAHAAFAPNRLVLSEAMQWAQRSGLTIFNWQSSPTRSGGVYGFKRLWGGEERRYYFVTRLLIPPDQIRDWGRETLVREFPGHYVVPFAMLTDRENAYFRKQ